MKVLVTGANGFLGQGIVKTLLEYGHIVIAADMATDHVDNRAKRVACNLFDIEEPYHYFEEPDALLHLAWRDGFVHDSAAHLNDLPLHYSFIEEFVQHSVSQICVLGSMHEIGFYEGSIDENTPCNPQSLYGISKNALRRAAEVLCAERGIPFKWLRGFYIVSNSQHGNSIFSKIVRAVQSGQKSFPFSSGQNQFDFVEYNEFCRQVAMAVTQSEVCGIINICSGKPAKLSEVVEEFIRANRYDITLEYGKFPDRPYDSKAVWGSDRKIRDILKGSKKSDISMPCKRS